MRARRYYEKYPAMEYISLNKHFEKKTFPMHLMFKDSLIEFVIKLVIIITITLHKTKCLVRN